LLTRISGIAPVFRLLPAHPVLTDGIGHLPDEPVRFVVPGPLRQDVAHPGIIPIHRIDGMEAPLVAPVEERIVEALLPRLVRLQDRPAFGRLVQDPVEARGHLDHVVVQKKLPFRSQWQRFHVKLPYLLIFCLRQQESFFRDKKGGKPAVRLKFNR
jgi:hypothetical protein